MDHYVDRNFASLDNLQTEMKKSRAVLVFTGPSGTGKTTTLIALYTVMCRTNAADEVAYANAALDKSCSAKCQYVFVDNAQCLKQNPSLCRSLECAKSLCFAFSPIVARSTGFVVSQCGYEYTNRYQFKPFTPTEIDQLVEKREKVDDTKLVVDTKLIDKIKEMNVCIPRILSQCHSEDDLLPWLHRAAMDYFFKLESRFRSQDPQDVANVNSLRQMTMKFVMLQKLDEIEEDLAVDLGLFYRSESGVLQLMFPVAIILKVLRKHIYSTYYLFKVFDKGAAFEFLVYAMLSHDDCKIQCMGENPTSVGRTMESRSNENPVLSIPAAKYSITQTLSSDCIEWKHCTVVKLYENHFAIDFLIYSEPNGAPSKKLFLVQVSITRYQQRSTPALDQIFVPKVQFGNQSVLDFYARKSGVRHNQCFFVYAAPDYPNDKTFTRNKNTVDKVYFLAVQCQS